jgi:glutamate-1-semialdehyde 2,1-aminomutase
VRFMENANPRNWADLLAADKNLGLRWAVELLKRGILVNPNEKFYISVAHTDADVDQTLEACDEAFAAVKRQ